MDGPICQNRGCAGVFLCPAQSLVKNLYVLIRISFNFHPFELRLKLWAYLRVRVTNIYAIYLYLKLYAPRTS